MLTPPINVDGKFDIRRQSLNEYSTNGMDRITIFMQPISAVHSAFAFPIYSGESKQIP